MKRALLKAAAIVMTMAVTTTTAKVEHMYQINAGQQIEVTGSVPDSQKEEAESSEAAPSEVPSEVSPSVPLPQAEIILDESSIAVKRDGKAYAKGNLTFSAEILRKDTEQTEAEIERVIESLSPPVWSGEGDYAASSAVWNEENQVVLQNQIPEEMQAMAREDYVLKAVYEENILDSKEVTVIWDNLAPVLSLRESTEELEKLRSDDVVISYQAEDKGYVTEAGEEIFGVGVKKVVAEFESRISGGYVPETIETTSLEELEVTVEQGKEFSGVCRIYAVDYLGNVSDAVEVPLNIDKAEPVITVMGRNNSGWQEETAVLVKIEDYRLCKDEAAPDIWYTFDKTGITERSHISCTKNVKESTAEKDVYDVAIQVKKSEHPDYGGTCTIYAADAAGNAVTGVQGKNQFEVDFDSTAPKFTDVTITDEERNSFESICNKLSFGLFFKDKIRLEVQAQDMVVNGAASGIQAMEMYADGIRYTPVIIQGNGVDSYVAVFLLEEEKKTEKITFTAIDNAGNKADAELSQINQSYAAAGIYIDRAAPVLAVTPLEEDLVKYRDKENHIWYNKEVSFEVKASDNLSGFETIEVEINGKKILREESGAVIVDLAFQKGCITQKTFRVSTSQASCQKDAQGKETGRYDITVTVTDHSGNGVTKKETVYVDVTKPHIESVEVTGAGNIEGNGQLTSSDRYEYFVKGNAKLLVTAADEKASSGVKSITYYTVNYSKNKLGEKSSEKTIAVDNKNQAVISLNSGFMGAVYVKAVDHTDHFTQNYQRPHLIATGTENKHIGNSAVTISLPKEIARDDNNDPLYAENLTADILVSDKDMGIASVEWSVTADYDTHNNTTGSLKIDKTGKVTQNSVFTVADKDKNLVTAMTGKIPINHDSNHIRIFVKITDRAGMTTQKEVFLSIDKHKPAVEVTYDNKSFDSAFAGEAEYYKDNRTAAIIVKERNFDPQKVQVKVTNKEGEVPSVTGWEKAVNTTSPDSTTYTAKVTFDTDGEYTLEVIAEDKAGNLADTYPQDRFTIDKTKPVIQITFDNNNTGQENYYKESRTATVTIKEHNFESSRVKVNRIQTNGENVTFPSMGAFQTEGNEHKAVLEFDSDGTYGFEVSYTDKAGNEAESVRSETFHIDTTEPEITFEGVEHHGAYRDEVTPMVLCHDENMDKNSLRAELRIVTIDGSRVVNALEEGEVSVLEGGCRLQLPSPKHSKENDGIYYLDVEMKDLAGNVCKETVVYSINRFGSVYTLSEEAKKASGKYIKDTSDIEILETNANEINMNEIKLKLTKNGNVTELKKDENYHIREMEEEGSWKQYSYVIDKENFKEDGVYMVTLSSTDKAGNTNENTAQEKKAELWFGVDNTSPVIVPLNVEAGATYNLAELQVEVEVQDNLKLAQVEVYVDEQKIEAQLNAEKECYTFALPESTSERKIKVVASDAAGNKTVEELGGIYVTTNWFVRFVHNKAVVSAVLVGTGAVLVLLGALAVLVRKRYTKQKQVEKS